MLWIINPPINISNDFFMWEKSFTIVLSEICQKIKNKGEEWNACIFNNGTQKYTTT